jgi:outer membrane lipoprotein-sorting protein
MNRRAHLRLRTLALLVVTFVTVFGLGVAGVIAATGAPSLDLPAVSPTSLLASVARAAESERPVSGSVMTHLDLGLPELPSASAADPNGVAAFLGDQRFKVWHSTDGVRVAQLLPFAERELIAGRSGLWTWNSVTATAVYTPMDPSPLRAMSRNVPGSLGDPVTVAGHLLDAVSREGDITMAPPAEVADRAAYVLSVSPTSPTTKIGRIEVAIDAETRIPLRVQVFGRGQTSPAIDVGFRSVSFDPIDPIMFEFSPPPGTTVRQASPPPELPRSGSGDSGTSQEPASGDSTDATREPHVFGQGFDLVVAVPVSDPGQLRSVLPFEGPLGSAALLQGSGGSWLVAGPVAPSALSAAAAKLP